MVVFAFNVFGAETKNAFLLARSIRDFGGTLASCPIWVFTPENVQKNNGNQSDFCRLQEIENLRLIPYELDWGLASFPYASKVVASAYAEKAVQGHADLLLWMDVDSLVLGDLTPWLLKRDKSFGYRPVDYMMIGSPYHTPPDPFWDLIYQECGVMEKSIFPVTTSVDEKEIWAYFNAGFLMVRPENRILQKWQELFLRLYQRKEFTAYYSDWRYKTFVHQALLSGAVLSMVRGNEMEPLPHTISFPLHLHQQYPLKKRPSSLNEVFSCRYDTLFDDPRWMDWIPMEEPLKSWFFRLV